MVVDGQWLSDPTNLQAETDDQGNLISLFTVEKEPVRPVLNPRREADGSVTFVFHGQPGRRVTIQGDFNNWDPFTSQLVETTPGCLPHHASAPPRRTLVPVLHRRQKASGHLQLGYGPRP